MVFHPGLRRKLLVVSEKKFSTTQINQSIINPERSNVKQHKVILPFKGKKGENTLRDVKRHITKLLPEQEEVALEEVVVWTYKILATDEAFFPSLQPLPWKVRNCLCMFNKTNIFNTIMQLVNPNYSYKIESN